MIPDFPVIKAKLEKVINKHLRESVKQNSPLISMMSRRNLYEGNKMGIIYPDGKHLVNELRSVHTEFSINYDEIPKLRPDDFISKVSGAAEDIAGQMERGMIEEIEKVVKMSGNVISDGVIEPGIILSMLDKIKITFEDDDRQKPNMPTIFSGMEAFNKLSDLMTNMTKTERDDFYAREKEILDRKYEEHIKNILSRGLID